MQAPRRATFLLGLAGLGFLSLGLPDGLPAHLAPTTKRDRECTLREDGPLLAYFGDAKLDAITPAAIREWWGREIVGRKAADGTVAPFKTTTGRADVNVLASVLGYARDLGLLKEDPIPTFREQIRLRSRTKRARAEAEESRQVRPIASLGELRKLVRPPRRRPSSTTRACTRCSARYPPAPPPASRSSPRCAMCEPPLRSGGVAAAERPRAVTYRARWITMLPPPIASGEALSMSSPALRTLS